MESEQALLIASLYAKGYTNKQLATLTGRTVRYITLARDSEQKIGRGGKVVSGKGQNLITIHKELNERGKVSPATIPERRQAKGGTTAKVRKGGTIIKRTGGRQDVLYPVIKAPETLKGAIADAGTSGRRVRWDIHIKKLKMYPDKPSKPGWISGHLPSGWTAKTLADRIANPQAADAWKPGDVNRALLVIALQQNPKVISATQPDAYNLLIADE